MQNVDSRREVLKGLVGAGVLLPMTGWAVNCNPTVPNPPVDPTAFGINVKDYGATGNGSCDDTEAMQAAIDAAASWVGTEPLPGTATLRKPSNIVWVPAGTYRCNVKMRPGVILQGEGIWGTTLRPMVDAPVISMKEDEQIQYIGIRDIHIVGQSEWPANDGISFYSLYPVNYINIHNVYIDNCGRYGMHMYGNGVAVGAAHAQGFLCTDLKIARSQNVGLLMEGACLENRFIHCAVSDNGLNGTVHNLELRHPSGSANFPVRTLFMGCVLNAPNTTGASVAIGGCEALLIQNCDFEKCHVAVDINANGIDGVRNIEINGCSFSAFHEINFDAFIRYQWANGLRVINNAFSMGPNTSCDHLVYADLIYEYASLREQQVSLENNTVNIDDTATVNGDYFKVKQATCRPENNILIKYNDHMSVYTRTRNAEYLVDYIGDKDSNASDGTVSDRSLLNGERVTLSGRPNTSEQSRSIRFRHGVGNLILAGGMDAVIDSEYGSLTLFWDGVSKLWKEIGRT